MVASKNKYEVCVYVRVSQKENRGWNMSLSYIICLNLKMKGFVMFLNYNKGKNKTERLTIFDKYFHLF